MSKKQRTTTESTESTDAAAAAADLLAWAGAKRRPMYPYPEEPGVNLASVCEVARADLDMAREELDSLFDFGVGASDELENEADSDETRAYAKTMREQALESYANAAHRLLRVRAKLMDIRRLVGEFDREDVRALLRAPRDKVAP